MSRASDNPFPSVLLVEGSAPANPASGDQRIYLDTADHKLKRVNSSGTVTTIEGGGGTLTSSSAYLGTNTTIGNGSDTDLATLSLAAGTWLLMGSVGFSTTGVSTVTAFIWDGATISGEGEWSCDAGYEATISVVALVTLGTTTTMKLSARGNNGGITAVKDEAVKTGGNKATGLIAVKIA